MYVEKHKCYVLIGKLIGKEKQNCQLTLIYINHLFILLYKCTISQLIINGGTKKLRQRYEYFCADISINQLKILLGYSFSFLC